MMPTNGHVMKPGETSFEPLSGRMAELVSKVFSKEMVGELVLIAASVVLFGFLLFAFNHALHNFTAVGPYSGFQTPVLNVFPGTFGGFILS
jgi:hypothetical protein